MQAKEEAAAAENARCLAEEKTGETEWEYDEEEMDGLVDEARERRRTKLQEAQREETARLTAKLQNGEITAEDFTAAMRDLLIAGADMFAVLGVEFSAPWIGVLLTGIFASRGSNYVSDLIGKIRERKTEE